MSDCLLCERQSEYRVRAVLSGVISGTILFKDGAEQLDVTEDELFEHLYRHEGSVAVVKPAYPSASDGVPYYIDRMRSMVERIDEWFNYVASSSDISDTKVRSMTSLAREMRETYKVMLDMKRNDQAHAELEVKYLDMKAKYELCVSTLMTEGCKACRERVMNQLRKARTS